MRLAKMYIGKLSRSKDAHARCMRGACTDDLKNNEHGLAFIPLHRREGALKQRPRTDRRCVDCFGKKKKYAELVGFVERRKYKSSNLPTYKIRKLPKRSVRFALATSALEQFSTRSYSVA